MDALDRAAVLARAGELMSGPKPAMLLTANALLAVEAAENPALADACRAAELSVADSVGLVWAAARLGEPSVTRLPGIDLAIDLCSLAAALEVPVFLLGAAPGVADEAADFLRRAVRGIVIGGTHDGFFAPEQETDVIGAMARSGARLTLVAFGTPKQELWIHERRGALPSGLYVGVGGSFDVWSGRLKRAPALFQSLGLEWAFRLVQEPSRFRRMLRLPTFAWRVLAETRTHR